MIQQLAQFLVYAFAMIGVLIVAYVVYKKTSIINPVKKNSMLKIVEILRLPDRKTLYIVKCKEEEFLIASSNDKVTLISKLNSKNVGNLDIEKYLKEKNEIECNSNEQLTKQESLMDKKTMVKSLLKELSDKNQAKRGNW